MTETERYLGTTPFQDIYDTFFALVTDDMYLEWEEEETYADIKNIFLASVSKFEFPRFKLFDYTLTPSDDGDYTVGDTFNFLLDREEINIFAHLMIVEWITRQIATANVTRQRYSSKDFEFTSQANHLSKLLNLRQTFKDESKSLQRLYKRRQIGSDGYITPNYSSFGGKENAN